MKGGRDEYETIEVIKDGAIDWLWLNRPDALNSINTQMVTDLRHYFDSLMENDETRVVLMGGRGRAYCAGLDIKSASSRNEKAPFGQGMGFQGYLAEVYIRMRRCPQPIISLVQDAACGEDLPSRSRVTSGSAENARFNAAFIKIGLSACDMGTSYFLPRLVGTSLASELMLTGRFIHADRALATQLVSQVVPEAELQAAGKALAEEVLLASPMGLRLTKDGLNMAVDAAD